ncbi:hypothetical protein ASE78_05800 [Sphingomonas sp. Leaf25]|nr:hypothetical protein ASE78_05800 [Sphingomonas sp. Leaf25]
MGRATDVEWPQPDMSMVSAGRYTAPTMPAAMFGDLWPLVADLAEGAGAPVDYVAIGVLATAASLIGAKRRIQPFESSPQWQEPCVLWVAPVGDPSSNKSPALDAATEPLRGIEQDKAEAHKNQLIYWQTQTERAKAERAQWQAQVKEATKVGEATPAMPLAAVEPEKPQRPRLIVQDGTPEAVVEILSGNPNGVLHLRDELAGWLTSFDRYSPGGREFWLEAYGGRRHRSDRKSNPNGPVSVSFTGVSVLGGIQPEKLSDCLLGTVDDGLVARFLWAWPEPRRYQRPQNIADMGLLETVYRRLSDLRAEMDESGAIVPDVLLLDDAAGQIFEEWIRSNDEAGTEAAGLFKGFLGKLRGMVLRLALVAELLAWAKCGGREPEAVSARTLVAVIQFIDLYAKPSALRVFGDAALPVDRRNAAQLAKLIVKNGWERVNARDLLKGGKIAKAKTAADVEAATDLLIDADWLRPAPAKIGPANGRPRKDFLVNPSVHGGSNA